MVSICDEGEIQQDMGWQEMDKEDMTIIKRGKEIGRADNYRCIWLACLDCGKERWVRLIGDIPATKRCPTCNMRVVQCRDDGHPHNYIDGLSNTLEGRRKYHLRTNLQRKVRAVIVKGEVLTHYGNGKLACVRCGFLDIRALSIDHIDGGGSEHTKRIKKVGFNFYRYLQKHSYPTGYQTLCMNCQWIKRIENGELYKYGKVDSGTN